MSTQPHTYPVWTTTFSAALGEELQYKYIILAPTPTNGQKLKCLKWEQHANRRVIVSGTAMTVDDGSFGGTEEIHTHFKQIWAADKYQVCL